MMRGETIEQDALMKKRNSRARNEVLFVFNAPRMVWGGLDKPDVP